MCFNNTPYTCNIKNFCLHLCSILFKKSSPRRATKGFLKCRNPGTSGGFAPSTPRSLKRAPGPPAMRGESSARYALQKFRKFYHKLLASLCCISTGKNPEMWHLRVIKLTIQYRRIMLDVITNFHLPFQLQSLNMCNLFIGSSEQVNVGHRHKHEYSYELAL